LWGTLGSLIFALAAAFHNIDDTLFWGRQSLSDSCSLLIVAKMAQLRISGLRALDQTHLLEGVERRRRATRSTAPFKSHLARN
jgi:hypothetical protein